MSEKRTVFTVSEVAAELNISDRAVRSAIARGTLAAAPVGAIWLVSRDAIDAYRVEHYNQRGQALKDAPVPPGVRPARRHKAAVTPLAPDAPQMPEGAACPFLYSLKEAAAFLGIKSVSGTLSTQIAKGKLNAIEHGRNKFIAYPELLRYQREAQGRKKVPAAPDRLSLKNEGL